MTASIHSKFRCIELVTKYELDGEQEHYVQNLSVQFLTQDTAAVVRSSGILDDFRLLFGERIVISPLPSGQFELDGIVHPSPMRHFESKGVGNMPFPAEELHRIGGDWETELMCWITHIPAAEFDNFCERTGLVFPSSSEIFSGISSIPL